MWLNPGDQNASEKNNGKCQGDPEGNGVNVNFAARKFGE